MGIYIDVLLSYMWFGVNCGRNQLVKL